MSVTEARKIIESEVRKELFGPSEDDAPVGRPIDTSNGYISFTSVEDSRGRFYDGITNQEIISSGTPLTRYGIGVLHGGGDISVDNSRENTDLTHVAGISHNNEDDFEPPVEILASSIRTESDADDFDLTSANSFKPSSMAISFQCRVSDDGLLHLKVDCAYYDRIAAKIPGNSKPVDWWVRRPLSLTASIRGTLLIERTHRLTTVSTMPNQLKARVLPTIQVFSRPVPNSSDHTLRLVTLAMINQVSSTGPDNSFFQVSFSLRPENGLEIVPYQDTQLTDLDAEEQSIELLYRNKQTYAIGHGCAAEWSTTADGKVVDSLGAAALPAYEVVSLTPNVYLTDSQGEYLRDSTGRRRALTISMKELAVGSTEASAQIKLLLDSYAAWIYARNAEISDLPWKYHVAAKDHIAKAESTLERMRTGWELVNTNEVARQAFRWTNEAMLLQQIRSSFPLRKVVRRKDGTISPDGPHPSLVVPPGRGAWRPFQIAFVLASLPELIDPSHHARDLVDLIFFPTGGGKTEAYLGASAVSLLARRLRNPKDSGTDTIMRYTLRLLTAQQFLRAASLICVLEDIRSHNQHALGASPFGIGIWVGGSSTPNTWKSAVDSISQLRKNASAKNPFLLLRCPWCGTELGTMPKGRHQQDVIGYELVGKRVVLRCIDQDCLYSRRSGLPVHVVDEDIYQSQPSLIIGTVDKFAMTAWKSEARALFGIGPEGTRLVSPPNLIIQDELHLISGPLGSMVGLYETIISELCTDRRSSKNTVPKIIAATATIRRYEEQVLALYGRTKTSLFPPHGLEEGRSFFAEPARDEMGQLEPGRRYLGIMSSSLGSMQTVQTRVTAATLQGAAKLPEDMRDGYWTNLNFLNSLRELGNTVSLLESDVPDYLSGLRRRDGIVPRWPKKILELTSRRRSDEIPKAIQELQVHYSPGNDSQDVIDICLASNIIEVGVDIDRLGLMTIVGQPKTTAQYIQVSGRVGRRPDTSPGLVITLYGATKPRDRSHYERFTPYHQQLYAQVEPTSVTPFATPVLRRALHAVAVAFIRQTVDADITPYPFPSKEYDEAMDLVHARSLLVDKKEAPVVKQIAAERAKEWRNWNRTEWNANPAPWGDPLEGLMQFAGTLPDEGRKFPIWDVPTSMRNVDAECRLNITTAYALEDGETTED
ncbi:helicase [Glutamicibacter halophytocola]|uniref:Helicase n=1 Tax=Glutamicibacter halophytocola TaxID=1933880 RepID=A0ABX5YAA1_9MICC|nr:helicase-related protein [Glutamicibacter halophytocola]QDY66594.1 helicase [Glutamicibacter halophytocola]